ncbi:MAG: DUF6569 family protein [Bacillota bacterium]
MEVAIGECLDRLHYGDPVQRENLTLVPLFFSVEVPVSYLLLEEALEQRVLQIGEVSEGGSVNEVLVRNRAEQPVLILDGEELVGAKQNRMVNATVLIPAKSEVKVPVSCVERGRWRYNAPEFQKAGVFGYASLRMQKAARVGRNLEAGEPFLADQGEIWAEIDRKQRAMDSRSDTDAIHDVYAHYEAKLHGLVGGLEPGADQDGVAAFIDGRFACLDLFASAATLKAVWGKLVKSYAMDALETAGRKEANGQADFGGVLELIRGCEYRVYPSVGQGTDIRLRGRGVVGACLLDEGGLLHLTVFGIKGSESEARMARPSRRRFTL